MKSAIRIVVDLAFYLIILGAVVALFLQSWLVFGGLVVVAMVIGYWVARLSREAAVTPSSKSE